MNSYLLSGILNVKHRRLFDDINRTRFRKESVSNHVSRGDSHNLQGRYIYDKCQCEVSVSKVDGRARPVRNWSTIRTARLSLN